MKKLLVILLMFNLFSCEKEVKEDSSPKEVQFRVVAVENTDSLLFSPVKLVINE